MTQFCGIFDTSRFDTLPDGIFDCRDVGEGWPTSLIVRDSQRNVSQVSTSEKNKTSISKSQRHTSSVRTSERYTSTASKSKRQKSTVETSEG